jgi:hypothetical protein
MRHIQAENAKRRKPRVPQRDFHDRGAAFGSVVMI